MTPREIRERVREMLRVNDMEAIASLARTEKRVINALIGLSYDKESLESWRAIAAMGIAVGALLPGSQEFVRNTVRKLLWSIMEESGGIGWSAPEMLGEIVRADPKGFSDLPPIIASFHSEDSFRGGVMYALGRIAEVSPELARPHEEQMMQALLDSNPMVRAYALLALRGAGLRGPEEVLRGLSSDASEVTLFVEGAFLQTRVRDLAQESLKR